MSAPRLRGSRALAGFTLCVALWCCSALAQVPVPPLSARVTDLTGTLDAGQRQVLEQKLAAFEASKGSQIAVLLVPTTQPEAIEQYSIRVAETWKIGRAQPDDGVILIVAKNDRTLRIEVGYGLEGVLNDATANRIIQETIVPRFRTDDYYAGITEGLDRIISVVAGEALPEPARRESRSQPRGFDSVLPIVLMAALVGGGLLRRLFGRVGGAITTSVLVGAIVWFIVSVLGIAFIAAVIAFFVALLGGGGGGGWYSPGRGRRGGWSGGGLGGGGFGGGGWSGGGGGFGGGGASGRW